MVREGHGTECGKLSVHQNQDKMLKSLVFDVMSVSR